MQSVLHVRGVRAGDDPALRCAALSLSPAALLLPPEAPWGPEGFFQRWASMACGECEHIPWRTLAGGWSC